MDPVLYVCMKSVKDAWHVWAASPSLPVALAMPHDQASPWRVVRSEWDSDERAYVPAGDVNINKIFSIGV